MCASFAVMLLSLFAMSVVAVEPPTKGQIESLVRQNIIASEDLDTDALFATIHPESPGVVTLEQLVDQLSAYELEMKPVRIEYIGMSDEYALVRVVQETRRVAGPDFMDNTTDGIWSLRQHDGQWLFWSQMLLRLEPLGRDSN